MTEELTDDPVVTEELTDDPVVTEELTDDPNEEERASPRARDGTGSEHAADGTDGADRSAADRSNGRTPHEDGGRGEQRDDDHLQDLPDGSGCTEIWEHIAEQRADDD